MKKVRVSKLKPGMLVREDDPTAGYFIGMEAVNVARAINNHDALVAALEGVMDLAAISVRGRCVNSVEAERLFAQGRAALASARNGGKS